MIKKSVIIFSLLFLTSIIVFSFGVSADVSCPNNHPENNPCPFDSSAPGQCNIGDYTGSIVYVLNMLGPTPILCGGEPVPISPDPNGRVYGICLGDGDQGEQYYKLCSFGCSNPTRNYSSCLGDYNSGEEGACYGYGFPSCFLKSQSECSPPCSWVTYPIMSSCVDFNDNQALCESTPGCSPQFQGEILCEASGGGGTTGGGNLNCEDSDGDNRYVKGTTTLTSYDGSREDFVDVCFNENGGEYVTEFLCNDIYLDGKEYYCEFGCNDGKCLSSPGGSTCEDTDGGNYKLNPGTVTYGGQTYKDTCYGSSTISENYCSGGARVSSAQGCGEGYSCFTNSNNEGYCAPTPSCTDSDEGKNYNIKGTVTKETGSTYTDFCYDGYFLGEYYCSGTNLGLESYQCPSGCNDGKCSSAPPFCGDTDGGNEPWLKGTVLTEVGSYTDVCFDSGGSGTGNVITGLAIIGNSLTENFCTPEKTRTTQSYSCNLGCYYGACSKLYFGDADGVELADYYSKNIGNLVYGWSRNIQPLQGAFDLSGKFQGDYTLTIKEYDLSSSDDIIRENIFITRDDPNNGYGFAWIITQEDVGKCAPGLEMEGDYCEFYFVLEDTALGITYDSRKTSLYLLVPVETPTTLPRRYWARPTDLTTQYSFAYWAGSPINLGLVMLNFTNPEGLPPTFSITERNNADSKFIGSSTGEVADRNNDEIQDAYAFWTIDQAVIDKVYPEFDNKWPLEFFFEIEGGLSGVFTLNYPQGVFCGDGICEPPENATNCSEDCGIPLQCLGINRCQNYLNENMCNNDDCEVAYNTPPVGEGSCLWDPNKEISCNKVTGGNLSNGNPVGLCVSEQNSTSDECTGGFFYYSWISTWTWDQLNVHSTLQECRDYAPECGDSGACLPDGGVYHCDPYGGQASCRDGSAQIPCPAQIQLDFFDLRNVIVAVLLILILYVIFYKVKKSRKSSKGKKRK